MTTRGTPSVIALWVLAILSWAWGVLLVEGSKSEGDASGTLVEAITGSVFIGAGVLVAGLALATQAVLATMRASAARTDASDR